MPKCTKKYLVNEVEMQHILWQNVNEANKRRGNSIEIQCVKSKDWKGKRAATQKKVKRNSGNTQRMDLHFISEGPGD